MSEKAIQRLKNKFILTASVSFFVVMTFIAGCIYVFNALMTRSQIKDNIMYIVENDGVLPMQYDSIESGDMKDNNQTIKNKNDFITQLEKLFGVESGYISDEFYYSTRYFAVTFDESGSVEKVITSHTAAVWDVMTFSTEPHCSSGTIASCYLRKYGNETLVQIRKL